MEKLETIQCDLAEYKITLQFQGRNSPLVVHFDTPSRRFYFSIIALIITEMKKQGRTGFVHMHRHQDILTRLDRSLSGKNASKHVEGMWAKIKMAWRHRLPDLESAALFKVLDRDLISPYEKGGKFRYQCAEAECDAWSSLFSYDENNTWRFKFAIDSASVDLADMSITLGDLRDNSAWEEFIKRLCIESAADKTLKESGGAAAPEPGPEDRVGHTRTRKVLWGMAAVVAAAIIAAVVWRFAVYKAPGPSDSIDLRNAVYPFGDKPSLAVLPFDNLTGDPQQEYFSDGIADQLITSLSQGPYLYVTARTSSFTFKGKSLPAQEIAAKLGVRYLIEGSVQRDKDRVRINVQLIDGRNGNHIWSKSYDRDFSDLFALQDDISMAVMAALNVQITGYTAGALKHSRPKNLKAYEHYLRGLYYHLGRKRDDVPRARQSFEEAIRIDPNYGRAYTWLANTYLDEIELRLTTQKEQVLEKAEEAVSKALAADPDYPPYGTLSRINRIKKDMENAILYARKGVQQGPNDSGQYYMLCLALHMGEEFAEAVDVCEDALGLTPFRPVNYVVQLAWALVGNKQYDEAIPLFMEVLDRSPKSFYAYLAYKGLVAAYQLTGRHADAQWAAQNAMRMNPNFSLERESRLSPVKEGPFKKRIMNAYRDAGLK
ncbi:MAG: tetratricopeptide repeat protein [Desulfobacterales bacterium]